MIGSNSIENIEHWRQAGKIAADVREYAKTIVKPGVKVLDVAEILEAKIRELGGEPAFPVNISLNHVAAHDTAAPQDTRVFRNEVVKVDVGVHIKGCIGDTACTIDLSGKYTDLVRAAEEALTAAIKTLALGTPIGAIGKSIQDTITARGFAPVRNLSGHGISVYDVHTEPGIPNYDTGEKRAITKGMIFAIEPFATTGAGKIQNSSNPLIFSQIATRPVRDNTTRQILAKIKEYHMLPFASRWLTKDFSPFQVQFALRQLVLSGILRDYPPLPEVAKGIVSQAEHTIIVTDKIEITTQ
ncbi:type II methionyl aminopeptidase [Candidatus Woesearchaeota archaeon]|nr:type II methionyl aminopeptidase [Candidatus Woesearchaeota archaeon]